MTFLLFARISVAHPNRNKIFFSCLDGHDRVAAYGKTEVSAVNSLMEECKNNSYFLTVSVEHIKGVDNLKIESVSQEDIHLAGADNRFVASGRCVFKTRDANQNWKLGL